MKNDLEEYFNNNEGRLIHKWIHYFEIYDRHFKNFRDRKKINILEIGVSHGGSLRMWRDYFGEKVKIYGVDINPECKKLEEEGVEIFIGSQSDRKFLREIKVKIPPVDILIDDGGHTMTQQIITFEELFEHVLPNGIYLCEDLHTSYWLRYGGGHKRRGTFIEYTKNFIDQLNAFHSEENSLKVDPFTRSVHSIHYYDSIIVIEKRPIEKPSHLQKGKISFEPEVIEKSRAAHILEKYKNDLIYYINYVLRLLRLPGVWWK